MFNVAVIEKERDGMIVLELRRSGTSAVSLKDTADMKLDC